MASLPKRLAWMVLNGAAALRPCASDVDLLGNFDRVVDLDVVHGHDNDALKLVRDYLVEIGVTPVILKDNEEPDDSLLRRFLQVAEQATFAVVVMSPDDFGASLTAYQAPRGGENALRYRARQNVILELGFFLDLAGAIFKEIGNEGRWKKLRKSALVKNGVEVR